jgi:hypothetical protein
MKRREPPEPMVFPERVKWSIGVARSRPKEIGADRVPTRSSSGNRVLLKNSIFLSGFPSCRRVQ